MWHPSAGEGGSAPRRGDWGAGLKSEENHSPRLDNHVEGVVTLGTELGAKERVELWELPDIPEDVSLSKLSEELL